MDSSGERAKQLEMGGWINGRMDRPVGEWMKGWPQKKDWSDVLCMDAPSTGASGLQELVKQFQKMY